MENEKGMKVIRYQGTIKTISGMLIGGPESDVQIGGVEKVPVQYRGEPYIPGSSLKGKLRSLLELKYKGTFRADKSGMCEDNSHFIGKLFGTPASASRVIVRDCFIDQKCREDIVGDSGDTERFYEIKMETAINRNTGRAEAGLRTFKRTVPGLVFKSEILLLVENEAEEKELTKRLEEAFALLNDSYLGSSGSRGYGQVEVKYDRV